MLLIPKGRKLFLIKLSHMQLSYGWKTGKKNEDHFSARNLTTDEIVWYPFIYSL